jgi:opacity protein-like surface antigen
MKMYLIAVVIAALGLWVSTAAQARDYCGLRSSTVLSVTDWSVEGKGDQIQFTITLKSGHDKAIRAVGGTVEFVGKGMHPLTRIQIRLDEVVEAKGETVIVYADAATEANKRLRAMTKNDVHVLACVDSVEFADGSGVIIN